jgi:hypothetical protein
MATDDEREARAQLARWFVEHDDVDEAARLLEPGDQLTLGRSDARNLEAALGRRGLSAGYEERRLLVRGVVPEGARKPPARAAGPVRSDARKRSA